MSWRYPFSGRFVYREGLLTALRERLEGGAGQVRIVGPVGAGKTSLVTQAVSQSFIRNRFPRGPVYFNMAEPNYNTAPVLSSMDIRLRGSRLSNYAQTSFRKAENGVIRSDPAAGDSRAVAQLRFGLSKIDLEAPREGYVVVLDNMSPLGSPWGDDLTREFATVYLGNIYPTDSNLYLSLMRPWESERIPYAEYGRPQDAVVVGGYTDKELWFAWKWQESPVFRMLYYNPLALTIYRGLEERGQVSPAQLAQAGMEDAPHWLHSLFLPWSIACEDSHWGGDFWMTLVTLSFLPECGSRSELAEAAHDKWQAASRKALGGKTGEVRSDVWIYNDLVNLEMAGLIAPDGAASEDTFYVSGLARLFAACWLKTRFGGLAEIDALVSFAGAHANGKNGRSWSLGLFKRLPGA